MRVERAVARAWIEDFEVARDRIGAVARLDGVRIGGVDPGEAPETVIVSSSAPTSRLALTVAANAPLRMMPERLTTLKSLSVKVTEYSPGRKSMMA